MDSPKLYNCKLYAPSFLILAKTLMSCIPSYCHRRRNVWDHQTMPWACGTCWMLNTLAWSTIKLILGSTWCSSAVSENLKSLLYSSYYQEPSTWTSYDYSAIFDETSDVKEVWSLFMMSHYTRICGDFTIYKWVNLTVECWVII